MTLDIIKFCCLFKILYKIFDFATTESKRMSYGETECASHVCDTAIRQENQSFIDLRGEHIRC